MFMTIISNNITTNNIVRNNKTKSDVWNSKFPVLLFACNALLSLQLIANVTNLRTKLKHNYIKLITF